MKISQRAWQMALANRGLIRTYIRRAGNLVSEHLLEDTEQEMLIALARACEKNDPSKGKLSTYAWFFLLQAATKINRSENRAALGSQKKPHDERVGDWCDNRSVDGEAHMNAAIDANKALSRMGDVGADIALDCARGRTLREIAKASGVKAWVLSYQLRRARRLLEHD